ncbi:MAG TPA: hypothetical protein VFM53_16105 [Anaeromyxobacteraceae bacterium]|nr:hypothetical protein [Anaeromyxobacteraceae bacterium]
MPFLPHGSARRPSARPVALAALAGALLATGTGCASIRLADERMAYYKSQVGTFTYQAGCLDAWPAVLKLLGEKGYPLEGRDRQYAGQGKQTAFGAFVDQGYETRAVEGGGLIVKTGWQFDSNGQSRYEVTGNPGQPSGCAITFTRIWAGTIDPSDERREVDWKIQLELLRKLEPATAARIEAGAPKGG